MSGADEITRVRKSDQWYRSAWTLDIVNMSWVEQTAGQVDFLWAVLGLSGRERVLDLACGFGRHALELASRGCSVVGVDITQAYVDEARRRARADGLDAEFACADLREVSYRDEFDVVLNLADGAIGYLEDDAENLRIFDAVSAALRPGGKHLMDVCSGAYAAKHFPKRGWEIGTHAISLSEFDWDGEARRMFYGGLELKFGDVLTRPREIACDPIRLYTPAELEVILRDRGMVVRETFGDYDLAVPASEDNLQLVVYSQKQA
jgi:SAM-dependent methyltransferase